MFCIYLPIIGLNLYICTPVFGMIIAWMAELVDALVSGTSVRKDVQVRVLFQAQLLPLTGDSTYTYTTRTHATVTAQVVELVDTPA